jgi:NADH-quinone oxidoreductase subunit N
MERDLQLLLPDIVLLLTAVFALVGEMLHRKQLVFITSLVGLILSFLLTIPVLNANTTVFSQTFRVDTLSIWAKLIVLPATALILLLTRFELGRTVRVGSIYTLLLFTALGAIVLAGSGDMMFLILGMLLTSLGSYALVTYPGSISATEAGMKYFIFGSISTALMLFGLTYWYGATGSTLLLDLPKASGMPLAALIGTIGVIAGLGYKASLVPFHFWTPDAYEGAPVSIAAYLSIIPKIGGLFALAQIAKNLPGGVDWTLLIILLAIATMTYGTVAALFQNNVKRLLAYSSIAQSGYFLFAVAFLGKSDLAVPGLIIFAAAYAAMNIGAFAVAAQVGTRLSDFGGLAKRKPWVAFAMVIFLLSLVGIPPLFGFIGKILLFGVAIENQAVLLATAGILNSVISLAVYLRIVAPMYWGRETQTPKLSLSVTFVWMTCLLITLIVGLSAAIWIFRFYQ